MEIIISIFLLFVGIAVLVIIHICIVGRAYRREFGIDGVPIIKGAGMPVDELRKLPCFAYKHNRQQSENVDVDVDDCEKDTSAMVASSDKKNNNNDDTNNTSTNNCAVCLESFEVDDICRMLPNCHHYFHVKCVDVWLKRSPFCPVCRTCTMVAIANLPSPKVVVASDGGVATVVSTNVPSINNPAAQELC